MLTKEQRSVIEALKKEAESLLEVQTGQQMDIVCDKLQTIMDDADTALLPIVLKPKFTDDPMKLYGACLGYIDFITSYDK